MDSLDALHNPTFAKDKHGLKFTAFEKRSQGDFLTQYYTGDNAENILKAFMKEYKADTIEALNKELEKDFVFLDKKEIAKILKS